MTSFTFSYLLAALCKDGTCSAEMCIRIASAMTAMARLNRIWRTNTISFTSKFRWYKSLVTSILLYGCEIWTLLTLEKINQAFETKCLWKLLHISYLSTRSMTGCRARPVSLWAHRNLFWQLSRDRNWHGLGVSCAIIAYPKPSIRAPWRVGDAVVSRGNAGWRTSKHGHRYQ